MTQTTPSFVEIYYWKAFDRQARIFLIINTDEDFSGRIENFAIINLRGVFTKLNSCFKIDLVTVLVSSTCGQIHGSQ